jgi:ParB family transcriptional regulator, chromosome partitioning protein
MSTARLEVDLHLLDLRFADARLLDPRAVERLASSIARDGQLVPCIAVGASPREGASATEHERLVLVDGYRRVAALRRLGRDRACVERWHCDLAEALLGVLARAPNRSFAAIEEALLLQEVTHGLGVSQRDAARRCGRDGSWVNRRLKLLSVLPEAAITAVRSGKLSSWAAARVVAPLARANGAHADRLLRAQSEARLSTRELRLWFDHYQKSRRCVRERMVEHPRLFLQAFNENAEQKSSECLRGGPEGQCETDLWRINELICRVRKRLPVLCPLSAELANALSRAQTNFSGLQHDINRYSQDDPDRDPQWRAAVEGAGPEPARDQSAAQALA